MKNAASVNTIPLFWVFEHWHDYNYQWTALMYIATFINGLFVSLNEFIAMGYYFAGDMRWIQWYSRTIGWVFSVFGGLVPPAFAVL